jgi:hypothetical protein
MQSCSRFLKLPQAAHSSCFKIPEAGTQAYTASEILKQLEYKCEQLYGSGIKSKIIKIIFLLNI